MFGIVVVLGAQGHQCHSAVEGVGGALHWQQGHTGHAIGSASLQIMAVRRSYVYTYYILPYIDFD